MEVRGLSSGPRYVKHGLLAIIYYEPYGRAYDHFRRASLVSMLPETKRRIKC